MTRFVRAPVFAASAALALVVGACVLAPVTGRSELDLVSEGTMNQLGVDTYKQQLAKAKPDPDPAHRAQVDRVAKRIVEAAERDFHPGYDWTVTALDDPKTVNAWCLPGGKIAVYSGILPLTKDDDGLAVVMAHEVSHALAHHGAERMSRSMLMQLGESGILAAVGAGKPEAVSTTAALLGLGAQLGIDLPFSRQQESEADRIGLVLMAKAGYDPSHAVGFWQRMTEYGKGKEPPAFLSDHPSSSDRVAAIERELPEARAAFVAHQ